MALRSFWQALLAIVLFLATVTSFAQVAVSPAEELHKRITVDHKVNTLTTDLFGDQIGLYMGSLSFNQTDVSLQGKSSLPVAVNRSFSVGSTYKLLLDSPGLFGDWLLDLPRVEVTVATQDLTNDAGRCHQAPQVALVATVNVEAWANWEYSQGYSLIIPGKGGQEILTRVSGKYTAAPGGNTDYNLVTKDHWQAQCITTSGTPDNFGDGYLFVSPNGTRYYLTEFRNRPASYMADTDGDSKYYLARSVFQALPSKVVDRFGNTVHYYYDAEGKLTKIKADDGREITLSYYGESHFANDQIKTVTAWPGTSKARTWHYYYEGDIYTSGPKYSSHLTRITLPGHTSSQPRQWLFEMAELAHAHTNTPNPWQGGTCSLSSVGGSYAGSMTHPMGTTGSFTVGAVKHGRANVDYDCRRKSATSSWFLWTPRNLYTLSLTGKGLSGPGLEPMTWSYHYSQTTGWFNNHTSPGGEAHEPDKWIEITGPDGHKTRHYFSIMWDGTEGQLLKTVYKNAAGNILRTVEKEYLLTDWRMSSEQFRVNGAKAGKTSHLTRLETHQNSDTYTKTLSNYTVFDQAQTIQRFTSGIPNQATRTETYTYINDTSVSAPSPTSTVWVIGLPNITTVNGIETVDYGYSGSTRQLTSIQEFGVTTAEFGYHADGTLAWFDDALDNRTTYSLYTLGIPKLIVYPDGTDLNLTVNPDGTIASKTNARGYTTSYDYDASGRLSEIDYPNNDTVNWADTTINFALVPSAEYGIGAGHWRQIVTRGDNQIVTYYDGLLRPLITRSRDMGGDVIFTSRAFDHAGRMLFTGYPIYSSDADYSTLSNYDPGTIASIDGIKKSYDALGRLTEIKDTSDGSATTISYLADNDKIVTGPLGNRTYYEYQVFDQPDYSTVTRIFTAYDDPERAITSIDRDILGRMLTVTQSGSYGGGTVSETRRYVYDSRGQLCKRVDPETGQSVFRFDDAGNLVWSATNVGGTATACEAGVTNSSYGSIPASKVVINQYDNRNRLIATDYPGGTADSCYDYDAVGNLTRLATLSEYGSSCPASGNLTRWEYGYNGLNLLTDETLYVDSRTFALSYGYNANGHKDQITYPTGRVFGLAPDGLGRVTGVGGLATDVDYHANGSIANFIYGSGAKYTASQTDGLLPEVIAITRSGSNQTSLNYDYDAANNVTRILDGVVSANTTTMSYDALNRLKTATASLWGTASYQYDPLGNLRQKTINGGTASYNYASNNRLASVTGSISRSYQYDTNGNVSADGNHQYVYDLANRLTAVTGAASYRYDGHGRRVKQVDVNNNETSYSVYSKAGKRMHQYNATTDTPEDFIYLGSLTIAKLAGPPVTPAVSSLNISGGPADGDYTVSWSTVQFANLYVLEERKNGGSWQSVYSGSAQSYAANNRSAGGYQYRIRACSDEGCGGWATSATAGVVPNAPGNITTPTGTTTDGSYTVSWSASTGATHYTLREQVNGSAWVTAQNTSSHSKSFNKGDGDYRYAVRACNSYGCSGYHYSATFTVETLPAVPTGLSVSGSTTGFYTVSWNAVSGAQRYELQQRSKYGSWSTIQNSSARSADVFLMGPERYFFRVRACKTVTCSGWSNEVSAYVSGGSGGGKW